MFKAEKIHITQYTGDYFYALTNCSTLEINGVLISNALFKKHLSEHGWQNFVCSDCGVECCNPVGLLVIRKMDDKLFIIPDFEQMDGFEEYDYDEDTGNRYCAPHEWYERGILIIEGEILKQFFQIMTDMSMDTVKEFTQEEIDLVIDWEEAVRLKPKGFMNIKNRQYDNKDYDKMGV
jgi:hypothetical protein